MHEINPTPVLLPRSRARRGYGGRRIVAGLVMIFVFVFGFCAGWMTAAAAEPGQTIKNVTSKGEAVKATQTLEPGRYGDITPSPVEAPQSEVDSWKLLLVNAQNPLDEGYTPELERVENYRFDARAADALRQMLAAAREEGLSPIVCSAYRSLQKQTELFENKVRYYMAQGYDTYEAEELAARVVARPGTSEHNLGLAADIVALSYQLLNGEQANTPESIWLRENCHRFGFVLRYPEDKEEITGIMYESWHYRYVGAEAAAEMMEGGLCLEEYLEQAAEV